MAAQDQVELQVEFHRWLSGTADHQLMEFHRWHTGAADHQLMEFCKPGLRGAAKFWGKILESLLDTACPRFLQVGNSD